MKLTLGDYVVKYDATPAEKKDGEERWLGRWAVYRAPLQGAGEPIDSGHTAHAFPDAVTAADAAKIHGISEAEGLQDGQK